MKHLSTILNAAKTVADRILENYSVLIHCSDSWDRTTQISSIAQLLLDPYYRTFEGFQVLIEKEWLAFGHKFSERCGRDPKDNERSPIFFQWLDCLSQLVHQHPCAFEFSSKLLIFLADEVAFF